MTDTSNSGPKADKPKQGFAAMDKTKQLEMASKGGIAAHAQGKAHEWNSEQAREAGRLGGQATRKNADGRRRTPPNPNTVVSEG